MNAPEYEVPIAVLEETLGVPLETASIEALNLDIDLVEALYFALKKYHRENRIPPAPGVFRPNVSFLSLSSGVLCEKDFDGYAAGDFIPRNGDFVIEMDWIKSTLLFSDEVVIEDPVFAFCRGVLCQRWQEAIPAFEVLRSALQNLALLRPLLEARLLRITAFFPEPISDPFADVEYDPDTGLRIAEVAAATGYRNVEAVLHAARALGTPLSALDATALPTVVSLIEQHGDDFEWLYKQAESIAYAREDGMPFHPFLPHQYQLGLFQRLIKDAPTLGVSEHLLSLFDMASLTSHSGIDPDQVDLKDLKNIRRDELVFEHWRQMVRTSLTQARQCAASGFSEIDAFRSAVMDAERAWNADFAKYNKGFLGSVLTEARGVSVSTVGAIVGAVLSGGNPLGAAIGAVGAGAAETIFRCLGQFDRFEAEQAAAASFLALRHRE